LLVVEDQLWFSLPPVLPMSSRLKMPIVTPVSVFDRRLLQAPPHPYTSFLKPFSFFPVPQWISLVFCFFPSKALPKTQLFLTLLRSVVRVWFSCPRSVVFLVPRLFLRNSFRPMIGTNRRSTDRFECWTARSRHAIPSTCSKISPSVELPFPP